MMPSQLRHKGEVCNTAPLQLNALSIGAAPNKTLFSEIPSCQKHKEKALFFFPNCSEKGCCMARSCSLELEIRAALTWAKVPKVHFCGWSNTLTTTLPSDFKICGFSATFTYFFCPLDSQTKKTIRKVKNHPFGHNEIILGRARKGSQGSCMVINYND